MNASKTPKTFYQYSKNLKSTPRNHSPPQLPPHLSFTATNNTISSIKNGPIKLERKINNESEDSSEDSKSKIKEEVKGRVNAVIKSDIRQRSDELNRQRKPTPLSKNRKTSGSMNAGEQKKQRPLTSQQQRPSSPVIHTKTTIRKKEIGRAHV